MEKKQDGGPAFPVPGLQHDEAFNGMTLRDYFAAQALTGFLHNAERIHFIDVPQVAEGAYKMADAMLRAREAV